MTRLVVFDKATQSPVGFYLGTHVVNEYIDLSDDLETNGYVSYVDPDGKVHFKLMSEVLLAEGEADE